MSTKIIPTVGRIIHFFPAVNDGIAQIGRGSPEVQPLAAIVVGVHSEDYVNLSVFDSYGNPHTRSSVYISSGDLPVDSGVSYAQWMPYQLGQAAKAEGKCGGNCAGCPTKGGEMLELKVVSGGVGIQDCVAFDDLTAESQQAVEAGLENGTLVEDVQQLMQEAGVGLPTPESTTYEDAPEIRAEKPVVDEAKKPAKAHKAKK